MYSEWESGGSTFYLLNMFVCVCVCVRKREVIFYRQSPVFKCTCTIHMYVQLLVHVCIQYPLVCTCTCIIMLEAIVYMYMGVYLVLD